MARIKFAADGRSATAEAAGRITSGSVGIPVDVTLSEDFDGLETWLVFRAGNASRDVAWEPGMAVTVPPECLRMPERTLHMGAYGALADGTIVVPTVWARVGTVAEGTRPSGFEPAGATPSWAVQVREEVRKMGEAVDRLGASSPVESLDSTRLTQTGPLVEVVGVPAYVADPASLPEWGIAEPGWYAFARVAARDGSTVTEATSVEGAAGSVIEPEADHVDVAVRFEVAAMAQVVTIAWGTLTESLVFRAGDLAVRNLDYRTTFYIYDLAPYATWEYGPATDETFIADHFYFLPDGEGGYEPAAVTIGDQVPADTYYQHTKVTLAGMPRNVTYRLNDVVDCAMEIVLPDVDDDGYGCWYELSVRRNGSYSLTLTPPDDDVKIASNGITSFSAGVDVTDLHYSNVGGVEVWRATNTHSNFTVPDPRVTGLTIRRPPTKVAYAAGEALDLTGIEVLLVFADGNTRLLDGTDSESLTYSPANGDALAAGTTEVTATYRSSRWGTFTATTPITVTGGE